jgi:hypothetical protein
MGKRSNFERNPRDFYPTPLEAVFPLLASLPAATKFIEPCAGDGRLIRHLEKYGHTCEYACDIEPQAEGIDTKDVLFFGADLPPTDMIITNPPWARDILHPMIDRFRQHAPTWLLFDSDWMFTGQAIPYLRYCRMIVSVGRVSWMGNGQSGMDNCAWFQFMPEACETIFISRGAD